jgi:hypothetical protein
MSAAYWPCGGELAAALLGAAGLTAMAPAHGADSAAQVAREVRAVSPFERVAIDAPASLLITQGAVESLVVEAERHVLPLLRTRVDNGTLVIGVVGSLQTALPIRMRVTMRTLALLRADGSADVRIGTLRTPALSLQLAGSSQTRMAELSADRFEPEVAGSSEMSVQRGQVQHQQVRVSDAARYNAAGLRSRETRIDVRGSGQALVHAEHRLDAQLSDSARLGYSGAPQLTQRVRDAAELQHTSFGQID